MLHLPWPDLAAMAFAVALGYTLFGFGGFGANIVALPLLAHFVPLRFAVPMMLLLDLVAAASVGLKNRQLIERAELLRLLPWLLAGMLIGATVLARAGERVLLGLLGAFVLAMALWSLASMRGGTKSLEPVSARWAWPAGLGGGVFSALFGSGGPLYTLYLARRVPDPGRLRASIATLILGAAAVRGVLFLANGLMAQPGLLQASLALGPGAALGFLAGSRLQARLPVARVRLGVWLMLMASGASLLVRSVGGS
ncbi:MAG: sulfite exporter TauE/SafE family protein [Rubrivivax sp.]|nr:sulfite exporter TauE/SafE family protein [Rubrivivax sp.]